MVSHQQDTVEQLVHKIDPEGVALSCHGKLCCHCFYCPSPNYLWSSNGHDKLKPYGITIYGFIDFCAH
ncbi:hypothetical protein CROQUDRAFT_52179 [Cronartium quercuum f. sp. fusiforme G11]|uniref:Uncharacterized protein n=1 Tax=Cronartium quercuum f. sp. fusiforme G11 TaxID=708437 RepID=A0A9P6NBS4_9BASI|nr:hypothetical protein CROQUDRAFT_52179 [Cronartium quercuum f. sp. fusiforme G11]